MQYVAMSGAIAGFGCGVVSVSSMYNLDASVTRKDTNSGAGPAQQNLLGVGSGSHLHPEETRVRGAVPRVTAHNPEGVHRFLSILYRL